LGRASQYSLRAH